MKLRAKIVFVGLFLLSASCAQPPLINVPVKNATVTTVPTVTARFIVSRTEIIQPTEVIGSYLLETPHGNEEIHPNSWINISSDKIQSYTFSFPIEFAKGKDGSVWYIGPFGIVWQKPDGEQVLFSNQEPNPYDFPDGNDFRLITIGPDGQVWAAGRNKLLFNFDGKAWINEGKNIPDASGKPNWTCYNKQIVGIDFGQDNSVWILTAEMEIYSLVSGQWGNFPNRISDEFMPIAGGGGCPQGIRVYSPDNIVIKRSGCCDSSPIGIQFDGKSWNKTDEPKDIKMMFQWHDNYFVSEWIDKKLFVFLAIHDKDKTINVAPFFSWLAPPRGTYVVEKKDSVIYITNQNMADNGALLAKFDKKTQTWKSFLIKDSDIGGLCGAYVDEEGYIWLQTICFDYDENGTFPPSLDGLYRLSPNIFDDYKIP